MICFLIRVQLSTLARNGASFLEVPSWVARRVDLWWERSRSIERAASLFLCARGTSCACGLLEHSTEPDGHNWQLKTQAGAALANVAHLLGTKMSPAGFVVAPMWVNGLYRASYPAPVEIIDLFSFIDRLIAGLLSKEVQYRVGREQDPLLSDEAHPTPPRQIFPGWNLRTCDLERGLPVFAR